MADKSEFMENLKQLFADCDTDQSGTLGRDEFRQLCERITNLSMDAIEETFDRLDIDKNGQITFDEFLTGFLNSVDHQSPSTGDGDSNFRQQKQPASSNIPVKRTLPKSPSPTTQPHQQRLSPTPVARARASTTSTVPKVGVLSLGGSPLRADRAGPQSPALNRPQSRGYNHQSTSSSGSTSFNVTQSSQSSSSFGITSIGDSSSSVDFASQAAHANALSQTDQQQQQNNVVVYSSDTLLDNSATQHPYSHEQMSGQSGQFGSILSNASSSGYNQVKTMQDLLECVQKLQNENQILTQTFMKDKRAREEYINQLGEEFDQQLKLVEERANKSAREELEAERKRLREMMQAERETLQNHYQTLERVSKLVSSPNGTAVDGLDNLLIQDGGVIKRVSSGASGLDGESIKKVKSQLEEENLQLKKSLLDTKTDVAKIWKEMSKLNKQYEEKLSSAYEKNRATQHECDHIKQQLTLMKDSNRKLQDTSDVISQYITEIEPVIKVASGCNLSDQSGDPADYKNGLMRGTVHSTASSRRGSILSDYLNDETNTGSSSLDKNILNKKSAKKDNENNSNSLQVLPRSDAKPASVSDRMSLDILAGDDDELAHSNGSGRSINLKTTESIKNKSSLGVDKHQKHVSKQDEKKRGIQSSLRNFGRNLLLGTRAQSDAKVRDADMLESGGKSLANKLQEAKSASADHANEPIIEPADGPSKATFDIILVGDSYVGKSSFVARFIEGNFVQGLIATCGIDSKTKTYKVDGQNYTVNIWDTAVFMLSHIEIDQRQQSGQERFRSMTASYFRKADGIILMYDVTEKRSYMNVRNWMSTISETAAENVAVLLVGNKIDLRNDDNKADCVPAEEGFRLAREYDIMFLETSVKLGTNLVPSMGRLIRLIAKRYTAEEEDKDRIKLSDKNRTFHCMPKNC